jgi:hypothetical protein
LYSNESALLFLASNIALKYPFTAFAIISFLF